MLSKISKLSDYRDVNREQNDKDSYWYVSIAHWNRNQDLNVKNRESKLAWICWVKMIIIITMYSIWYILCDTYIISYHGAMATELHTSDPIDICYHVDSF